MDKWSRFEHWSLVLPPSRPSAAQLGAIARTVNPLDRAAPVAILGSTPEFRDLFFELGFSRIYVFDKNRQFHALASRLRIHGGKEEFVHGDWRESLPRFREFFGLVVSDLTSGNIPYEGREAFYSGIAAALRPGGHFFDKVLTHPGPNIPVADLFDKYDRMPLNLATINSYSCEMLFCSTLLDEREIVDSRSFYEFLDSESPTPRLKAFAAEARYITPDDCVWYYGHRWSELEPGYCRGLSRRDYVSEEASSPYYGRVRHFLVIRGGG